jgi:microcystin-dependent protein
MADPFMSQISLFGCSYPPRDWTWCQGQLMEISDYNAIYALVGTIYGGDGRVTFGVPNLIGRVPIGNGSAPGITTRYIGYMGGAEYVQLGISDMPAHNHTAAAHATSGGSLSGTPNANATVKCNNSGSTTNEPAGKVWGKFTGRDGTLYAESVGTNDEMHAGLVNVTVDMSTVDINVQTVVDSVSINDTGGDDAHYNLQPYQVVPYSFSLDGVFPPRS